MSFQPIFNQPPAPKPQQPDQQPSGGSAPGVYQGGVTPVGFSGGAGGALPPGVGGNSGVGQGAYWATSGVPGAGGTVSNGILNVNANGQSNNSAGGSVTPSLSAWNDGNGNTMHHHGGHGQMGQHIPQPGMGQGQMPGMGQGQMPGMGGQLSMGGNPNFQEYQGSAPTNPYASNPGSPQTPVGGTFQNQTPVNPMNNTQRPPWATNHNQWQWGQQSQAAPGQNTVGGTLPDIGG